MKSIRRAFTRKLPPRTKKRVITRFERGQIELGKIKKLTQEAIARRLGRRQSTISYEICKNSRNGECTADIAQIMCDTRAAEVKGFQLWHYPDNLNAVKYCIRAGMPQTRIQGYLERMMPNLEGITYKRIRDVVKEDKKNGGSLSKFIQRGRPTSSTLRRLNEFELFITPVGGWKHGSWPLGLCKGDENVRAPALRLH